MRLLIFLLAIMGCLVLVILYSALVVASDEDDKEEENGRLRSKGGKGNR